MEEKQIYKKTVAQKLLIRENLKVLFVNEPDDYRKTLGELPSNVAVLTQPSEPVDLIQVFVTSRKELEEELHKLKPFLKPKGLLWITYPKGTSQVARTRKVDINRDSIWKIAEQIGLKPVSMISVDETWSAFRFKIV